MTSIAQQLQDLDARRKRWMSRLTRAHTAIKQLEAKRLRLLKKQTPPSLGTAPEEVIPAAIAPKRELSTETVAAPQGVVAEAVKVLEDNDAMPDWLRRGYAAQKSVDEILDVEKMKAERKKKEEAERHKMPLTGKAAMAAIRKKK